MLMELKIQYGEHWPENSKIRAGKFSKAKGKTKPGIFPSSRENLNSLSDYIHINFFYNNMTFSVLTIKYFTNIFILPLSVKLLYPP